jgi:hypothetical protein
MPAAMARRCTDFAHIEARLTRSPIICTRAFLPPVEPDQRFLSHFVACETNRHTLKHILYSGYFAKVAQICQAFVHILLRQKATLPVDSFK